MTIRIYRDIACTDGADYYAKLAWYMMTHGWTLTSYSTGNGGARATSAPANAAALATALRTGHSSWQCLTNGNRKVSWHRSNAANPDYSNWRMEYTATGVLTSGSATAPDRHSTDSQYISGNFFRNTAPVTGGTADAIKAHFIIDDTGPSFLGLARRTPLPAGNVGFFSADGLDLCTDPVWAGNPDPAVLIHVGAGSNTGDTQLLSNSYQNAWLGYGLPGATWTGCFLENPGAVAGSATPDKSGVDVLYAVRWVFGSGVGHIGTSRLFRLLHPGRTPIAGIDANARLDWAAFWSVAVPNDGTALGS